MAGVRVCSLYCVCSLYGLSIEDAYLRHPVCQMSGRQGVVPPSHLPKVVLNDHFWQVGGGLP